MGLVAPTQWLKFGTLYTNFLLYFQQAATTTRRVTKRMPCPLCSDTVMLSIVAVSSLVFLTVGCIFVAPYWLYDGASFLLAFVLGLLACWGTCWGNVPGESMEEPDSTDRDTNSYATATWCVAAFSILVDIGFMITALMLWNEEMNPFHWSSYGRDGNSFFFCSMYSAICNTFLVFHFRNLHTATAAQLKEQSASYQSEEAVDKSQALVDKSAAKAAPITSDPPEQL